MFIIDQRRNSVRFVDDNYHLAVSTRLHTFDLVYLEHVGAAIFSLVIYGHFNTVLLAFKCLITFNKKRLN